MLLAVNHVINIFVVIGEQPIANEIRVPRLNSGSLEKTFAVFNITWTGHVMSLGISHVRVVCH